MSMQRRTTRLGIAGATLLAAFVALQPGIARAWGDDGHMIVATIAYRHLTRSVKPKLDQMLRDDKDRLTARDIANRATWADRYRDSDRSTGKQRYELTREWHFVDLEIDAPDLDAACFGHPPAEVPASAGPAHACVVDRITAFAAELKQLPASDREKTIALKFLLHLVGDLHQPLHAADRHDRGGNDVGVMFGQHRVGMPLHAYWDRDAVAALGPDVAKVASTLDRTYRSRCSGWMTGTPADWAMESFTVAKTVVYVLGEPTQDEHQRPAFRLDDAYQAKAAAVAGEQLAKAGCRLAMILNQALK
jgi:hypothetical protein